MPSNALTRINRLTKEIADLQGVDAKEASKELKIQSVINRAAEAIRRTKNTSTIRSRQLEMERRSSELARIQERRANTAKKIASKIVQRTQYETQRDREQEREQKRRVEEQKRQMKERERHERNITNEIRRRPSMTSALAFKELPPDSQDFFICHASEDKDSFVRQLATSLKDGGASVWFDEFTLNVGDSLRQEIDKGLARSRFGIVVLSRHFFAKEWPMQELNGLFALDMHGPKRILPIWLDISKDEITRHSPMLADRVAYNTSRSTVDEIVLELLELRGTC